MEMPLVKSCAARECAYNQDRACHALAITIGDARQAHCDTFFQVSFKGGDESARGHVGACKMSDCVHNTSLECRAPDITVGYQTDSVDCLTYQTA